MRMLDRKEFLALEGEHVFVKYGDSETGTLAIKTDTEGGSNDFFYQELDPPEQMYSREKLSDMKKDSTLWEHLYFYEERRDKYFEGDEVKFLVLSRQDVEHLIARLKDTIR